jgi:hypothetical protein
MDWYQFESTNVPGYFIRHRNFAGELTEKDGALDDFAFTLVRRGAQNRMAFRSVNFPDRYLRHRDLRVWLEGPSYDGDAQFAADSTFFLVRGLADPDGMSFRASNAAEGYLRHRDFHLWVEAPAAGPGDQQFRRDATFHRSLAPVHFDGGPDGGIVGVPVTE